MSVPREGNAPSVLQQGAIVGDRYAIEQELGGGGMAVVYRARHVGLEHEVALEVVLPEVRSIPGVAERFVREARADARADIWGLGVVLHELLTGAPPYDGPSFVDIYAAILRARPNPPSAHQPEVPRGLDDVVLRCLEPDPAERFPDVAALARALVAGAHDALAAEPEDPNVLFEDRQ